MIVNANSIVQHVIQIKNGIMKHVDVSVKIIINAKKIIVAYICENDECLKGIADESVITCNETIVITNNIQTNVASNVSINSDDKKSKT